MYSCAYFPRPGASLEEAQLAKLSGSASGCGSGPRTTCWRSAPAGAAWRSTPPREHGCRVTTTTISREQHELADARGSARPGSRTGSRSCSRTTATSRPLRPARLGRDDRGGRLAVLRRLLPPLRPAAQRRRADAAAGDHDRRPPLRDREGGAELRQHPRLPRRLPALGAADRRLPRARTRACARSGSTTSPPTTRRPSPPGASASSPPGSGCARAATTSASAGSGTST